jgi:group I intron endonuclease
MQSFVGYIYIIENTINSKLYVGQTIDPYKRKSAHFSQTSQSKGGLVINKAMIKHGRTNFDFVLLDTAYSKEELDDKEMYWIRTLNSLTPNGYNRELGGHAGPVPGRKHSPESIEKMRECKLGAKNPAFGKEHNKEWKENMSLRMSGENHPLFGKKFSEESRNKMRQSHLGMVLTEEHKQKIAEAHKGNNNAFFGKTHSLATRNKMKEAAKLKPKTIISKETRAKMVESRKKIGWHKRFRKQEDTDPNKGDA